MDCRGSTVLSVISSCLGMILLVEENRSLCLRFLGSSLSLFWTLLSVPAAFKLML